MDTERMDIGEFLTARYDEEQQLAEAAVPGPWHIELLGGKGYPQRISNARAIVIGQTYTNPAYPPVNAEHMVYWDPARVLADIAAKRALLAYLVRLAEVILDNNLWSLEGESDHGLRLLAAPYATHPDYDPAWSLT